MESWILNSTQRYAACGVFAIALNQSQRHQVRLTSTLPSLDDEPIGMGMTAVENATVSDRPYLWVHHHSSLLLPVFRFMRVDDKTWDGLKETAGSSSQIRHHIGSFLKLLSDEGAPTPSESVDKEVALLKAVEAIAISMEAPDSTTLDSGQKLENKPRPCEKDSHPITETAHGAEIVHDDMAAKDQLDNTCKSQTCEKPVEDGALLSSRRKVTVLYELLSACLLGTTVDSQNASQSFKGYDSRHRVALRLLATWLDVRWIKMEAMEIMVASSMMDLIKGEVEKRDDADPWAEWKQGGLVGAAAVAGGAVMALTGGVIAPAVAQGLSVAAPTLGSLLPAIGAGGFAAAAAAVGSLGGAVAVAASFGAAGAGLCGYKMARRTGSIEDFEFKAIGENHKQGRLAVGIMVSGLVFNEDDFVKPWDIQNFNLERYALHWEYDHLVALSTAVRDLIASKITVQLMTLGATMTVLGSLMSALTLPVSLIAASDMIDSKWAVGLDRSDKAGKLLAEVLLEGHHGNRPVTLIGFSLGARVVFKCLQSLAETEGDHAGLVERVVLLGAPVSLKDENWIQARKMVSGRFVNAYSTTDWTLGVAFRSNLISQGLAGLQPVDAPGIENVDVTHIVDGHAAYIWMTEHIVKRLELDTYYPVWKDVTTESFTAKNVQTLSSHS